MLTEWEWRKQTVQKQKKRTVCWGAQYVIAHRRHRQVRFCRAFPFVLLFLACSTAAALPALFPPAVSHGFAKLQSQETPAAVQPRQVDEIIYAFPENLPGSIYTYTRSQLLRGKMLLLNKTHPLPADVPAPNTLSAALYGKGMVPVRNLHIRSGPGTIDALKELFGTLQARGVTGLCVWDGTVSRAEQHERMVLYARQLMRTQPVQDAVQNTFAALDAPGEGEMLQEYTVELRFHSAAADTPQEIAFEDTLAGQQLLQTAWRCGFIRTQPDAQDRHAFRFRWVGKAHAAAMTYLQLSFEDYLLWMHEKGVLTLWEAGTPKYVIVCKPLNGTQVSFTLPSGAICDASLDNMGYALVAAELP